MMRLLLTFIILFSCQAHAQVNYMDLANLLINNGSLGRGLEALKKVKFEGEKAESKYLTIYGRYFEKSQNPQMALMNYTKAIQLDADNLQAYLNKSQVLLSQEKYSEVIKLLSAKKELQTKLSYFLAMSISYQSSKDFEKAWEVLHVGINTFPKNTLLQKQKWMLLVELNLYQESLDFLISDMTRFNGQDYLGFINEYANRNQIDVSQKLATYAEQLFPENIKIKKAIVANFVRKKQFLMASNYLDKYIYHINNDDLLDLAVRINQKLKRFKRAEFLANFFQSENLRVESKVSELLAREDYEQLIQMERKVVPLKLKNKDDVLYAIAYGHYSVGNYKKAIRRLDELTGDKIIKKSMALKATVLECIGDQFACSL